MDDFEAIDQANASTDEAAFRDEFNGEAKLNLDEKATWEKKIEHSSRTLGRDPREFQAFISGLKALNLILVILLFVVPFLRFIWVFQEGKENVQNEAQYSVYGSAFEYDVDLLDAGEQFGEMITRWTLGSDALEKIEEDMLSGRLEEALQACKVIVENNPNKEESLVFLAQLYESVKDYNEAAGVYVRLLHNYPLNQKYVKSLIASLFALGENSSVIVLSEWYSSLTDMTESQKIIYADAHYNLEKYAEAATLYGRILMNKSFDPELMYKQALAYIYSRQFDSADRNINLLAYKLKDDFDERKLRAFSLAMQGRLDEVFTFLRQVSEEKGYDTVLSYCEDKAFDEIREEPRFIQCIEEISMLKNEQSNKVQSLSSVKKLDVKE